MGDLYPLRLRPQVKEVVWGGSWLADNLGRGGPPKAKLGESWEAYSDSLVVNGNWTGHTLADLFTHVGEKYLGQAAMRYPKFPLLVKFIDAHDNLSVQVHPNDKLAQQLEAYPFGKTEFWYIVEAEPDAEICYGLKAIAKDRAELEQAISDGTVLNFLQRSPVQAGDVVFLPAGTVHALTKGIVVYELQQDCDITYRLYDWGRVGRPIHIEKGLQSINFDYKNMQVTQPKLAQIENYKQAKLVECEYFTADLLQIEHNANFESATDSFTLISVLDGTGRIVSPTNDFEVEKVSKGDTLLLPYGLAYRLEKSDEAKRLGVIRGWLVG